MSFVKKTSLSMDAPVIGCDKKLRGDPPGYWITIAVHISNIAYLVDTQQLNFMTEINSLFRRGTVRGRRA